MTTRKMTQNDPAPRRRIVTICGSTRHWDILLEVAEALSVAGDIVLFPFVNMKSGSWAGTLGQVVKANLDDMHLDKIGMSDAIYVVNVDGYIGESTQKEIEFATHEEVEILYLEPAEYTNRPDLITVEQVENAN